MRLRSLGASVLRLVLLGAGVGLAGSTVIRADSGTEALDDGLPPPADHTVDFAHDIRPILATNCTTCHGPEQRKGGLRLDAKAEALAGGDSGPAFEPGKSAESELIFRVTETDPTLAMPPEGTRLTPEQVGLLRAWIDQGAAWPDGLEETATAPGSDHWAFQPPVRHEPPAVRNAEWVRNPIDAFVLARLEREGIAPAPEADRRALIRRLSLDLLGLPPSPEDVRAFVADTRPDAYERLVDRLLDSPHYGERWGRLWLDLARYADSDGYEKDSPRPYAYRYRDWVIQALNADMPYDRFSIEQLAGDLLPDATLDQKTATGFHRNTLTNKEGGVDQEEFRVAAVVDRVATTGTVWLGLTVACAQCHTHKYDPITQREYYGLFAFFNTSEEIDLPAPLPGDRERDEQAKAAHDTAHAKLTDRLAKDDRDRRPARQAEWEAAVLAGTDKVPPDSVPPAEIRSILDIPATERTEAQAEQVADHHRTIDPEYQKLKRAVEAHAKKAPKPSATHVRTLAEPAGTPRPTHILIKGDFLRPGEPVEPTTPAVLPPLETEGPTPTRLDLARWLMAPENPLTARVAVNRIWGHLFGRPLVTTPDDLGTRGAPPTHPELLDWLATEYPRLGWSQKGLIRLLVTSSTYRQSSATRPELIDRDPNNELLARQARFRPEAEVVRDLFLSASGLLAPTVGGPSVRPPQPPGISELTYAGSARWVDSTGADRYRRGLYTWFQRTSPYPMLLTFDAPDANVCKVARERSNTPLQALTLLNDAVFVEAAQALARRILAESPDCSTEARLRHAFEVCTARPPTAEELSLLVPLFDRFSDACRRDPEAARTLAGPGLPEGVSPADAAAWTLLARTILNLDETLTRE